jgi:hypothetical protein
MSMTITITADGPLTEQEIGVLQILLGDVRPGATTEQAEAPPAAKKSTPAPAPEPEEDLLGPTLEEAVARATKLVADGKTADVKKALGEAGVKRVSELSGDKIATFMAALDG